MTVLCVAVLCAQHSGNAEKCEKTYIPEHTFLQPVLLDMPSRTMQCNHKQGEEKRLKNEKK
jgi:hypothetical protein